MLGPLLFAVYCSPVADVISEHGVSYHQYADDTQLRLSLRADNTAEGLTVLATCTVTSLASLFCYATSLQSDYQNQLRRPCFSLLRSC